MANYYDIGYYGYADDDEIYSHSSDMSMTKNMKKNLLEMNKSDKNFIQLKRTNKSFYSREETVGVFGSGEVGTSIRDAKTGVRNFVHKVGSAEEDLYFKVMISTGETGQNPVTLFFNTPEEYERHMFSEVSTETKQRWHAKNFAAKQREMNSISNGSRIRGQNMVVIH